MNTPTQVIVNTYVAPPIYSEQEYYERPWNVYCDFCGDTATDTQHNLKRAGWWLSSECMCPICCDKV